MTTGQRSAALPEVATVAESGYPGYESNSWQGIVTRAYIRSEMEKWGKVIQIAGVKNE